MQAKHNWDSYFMTMAYLVATKSKDPSSKVGAVIVGPDREVRSTGYNGLPRGLNDTEERYAKPLKYNLINHAEENAILNCSRIGTSTKGCSLYVPWIPCSLCTKSIIQAGIIEVIYHENWPGNSCKESDWADSIKLSNQMFNEAKVILRNFSDNIIPITGMYQGKFFNLY